MPGLGQWGLSMARPRSMESTLTRTSSLIENEENPTMYSSQFTDKSASMKASRSLYTKVVAGGTLGMTIVMFCVFSIYWGAPVEDTGPQFTRVGCGG